MSCLCASCCQCSDWLVPGTFVYSSSSDWTVTGVSCQPVANLVNGGADLYKLTDFCEWTAFKAPDFFNWVFFDLTRSGTTFTLTIKASCVDYSTSLLTYTTTTSECCDPTITLELQSYSGAMFSVYPVSITLTSGDCAACLGDPHFTGFRKQKFDCHGTPNQIYNLISDANVQYNASFIPCIQPGATHIDHVGLKLNKKHIFFHKTAKPTLNNQEIPVNQLIEFPSGLHDIKANLLYNGSKLTVFTGKYVISMWPGMEWYEPLVNQEFKLAGHGILADGVIPNGIIGMTVKGDFDGNHEQFKMKSLWSECDLNSSVNPIKGILNIRML